MSSRGKIARAAGVMSAATFISRVLGFIRDMILARFFGATGTSDVFFVAFRIPNLLRELFAEGSMSSAFVPVLTEYQTRQGNEEANRLVRATFIFLFVVVGLICIAGVMFAPAIVKMIAIGWETGSEKFASAVLLTRIMFPFLFFISLASVVMGALNTRGVFFVPALAPAVLNIVTIACIVGLALEFANPVIAAAIGVTAGGFVQLLFQLPSFFKHGFSFSQSRGAALPRYKGLHPGLKRIGTLILPMTAVLAVSQINIFISTILASYLSEGSISYLYYSMRLIQFPIGIFGVAMGMAVLPTLSEHAAMKQFGALKDDFSFALRLLLFITVPAMVGLIALRVPIVSTLFQHGEFSRAATMGTADALVFYSVGIWAIVGVRTLNATFYSMQDTRTPFKIMVCGVLLNILCSVGLMGPLSYNGLAFANSLAAMFNFLLLFYFLRKKLGGVGTRRIVSSFAKTCFAAAAMGICGWSATRGDLWTMGGHTGQKAFLLMVAIVGCLGIYFIASYFLRIEEMAYLVKKVREKVGNNA
ncbi:MAG TPA: murein biosynthesis integral membrane protein MurJ [Dissulfurispiraceae bacterium]|nr:murein biosynthesis integral membrane protein MurJ [Dissulfurispiraceae bacterium]